MEVSAVLTVAAEVAGAASLVEVSRRAYDWLKFRALAAHEVEDAKELLGIRKGEGVAYRHDSVHPLYSSGPWLHPDNLAALTAAAGNEFRRAREIRRLYRSETVTTALNSNLVLLGSPTAEGLSRPVFGYEPDLDQDSLVLRHPPLDLPLKWILSKAEIDEHAVAKRYVAERGLVARPNWRIDAGNRLFVPEVDATGFLSVDYLVVTRVRNYLSPEALDEGKYIVSFAGAHGTATRAIEVLLRDRETLRKIAHHLSSRPAAYQLLLRVGGMEHNAVTGTRATRVELVGDPIILPDTYGAWQEAVNIARSNLQLWLTSIGRN